MEIQITGLVSKEHSEKLKISLMDNCIACFVDYSSYDIPIQYVFKSAKYKDSIKMYSGDFQVVYITQQFGISWNNIPKGWKTVCVIRMNSLAAICRLKEVPTWDYNATPLILRN